MGTNMEITSMKKEGTKLFITLELSGDPDLSFLEKEESLAQLLNEVGVLSTVHLLESEDSTTSILDENGVRYYAKSCQKKV